MKAFLVVGRIPYEGEETTLVAANSRQEAIDYCNQGINASMYDRINCNEIKNVTVDPSIKTVCELV